MMVSVGSILYSSRWIMYSKSLSSTRMMMVGRGSSLSLSFRRYHLSTSTNMNNGNQKNQLVRLSKRMSELDLCSRREADRIIQQGNRILVQGKVVDPIVGQKVNSDETDIIILTENGKTTTSSTTTKYTCGDTIVLNKPIGYVSGQPEQKNSSNGTNIIPAVRLLTRQNLFLREKDEKDESRHILSNGNYLHFQKKSKQNVSTLFGYAPAGRLDLSSHGLIIFTKNGVMAKKIVSSGNNKSMEKEYIVHVMDAQQPTRNERAMGLHSIPKPNTNLKPLLRGGIKLWKDTKPLKPLIHAEWISMDTSSPNNFHGTLRFILQEGKKHQIRRMCREILGMHVIQLQRIRIGPVHLHDLPEGKWRYVSYNYTHLYCRCN